MLLLCSSSVLIQSYLTAKIQNKAIVDYTSPALYTPITPFPAVPIFIKRGSDRMILVLYYVFGDGMIPVAASAL